MSTDRVTWRLLAPSARRRADSRTRCETRIEKVLKMMKAPTTIAMTAKVVRKIEMTSRNWPIWSWVSFTTSSPVTPAKPSGATASAAAASSACETPSAAVSATLVKASWPSRKISCASAVSSSTRVAPAVPPPLKSAVPTSVKVRRVSPRVGTIIVTSSPTAYDPRSADDVSRVISPGSDGHSPAVSSRICSPAMFSVGA